MYTEKSVRLKTDFYCRYGNGGGTLYFERTGLPCKIMEGNSKFIAFSFDCGVRAYGRNGGDMLKILNSDTNVCDVRFVKGGRGSQILYKTDLPNVNGMRDTVRYTVAKLLVKMGNAGSEPERGSLVGVCDTFAANGWCAVSERGSVCRVPLPLFDYNVVLIRPRRGRFYGSDAIPQFREGEDGRICATASALRECDTETFFEMVGESERSLERLLLPSEKLLGAVGAVRDCDGVCAVRICDAGIVAFARKDMIDNVINGFNRNCCRRLGYSLPIAVVK